MSTAISVPPTLTLKMNLTDEQFWQLYQDNRDLRFERTATGEVIIMPPTGGMTGNRNSEINFQLRLWNRQNKLGRVFDSSTGFKLPNGAERSPDASLVEMERWNSLTRAEQEKFVPLCPDFVVELRSHPPAEGIPPTRGDYGGLQNQMKEYLNNGAKLGWLIDPSRKVVEIYRPNEAVETLQSPTTVSGEAVLPGFALDLSEIFN